MPETVPISLELPKELINRIQSVKPSWLGDLTDEQFLGHVISHGDFEAYLDQIRQANQQVQNLTTGLHLTKNGPDTPRRAKAARRPSVPPANAPTEKTSAST